MGAHYGLNVLDNCVTCPVREEHLFCNLSVHVVQRLNEIKATAVYPKGAMLFMEGQRPRGVFVLCAGRRNSPLLPSEAQRSFRKCPSQATFLALMRSFRTALTKLLLK